MHGTHQPHDSSQLCEIGTPLYATALRDGHLCQELARAAPCLLESALLQPDVHAPGRLIPTPPTLALPRLLQELEADELAVRAHQERLAEVFTPLLDASRSLRDTAPAAEVVVLGEASRAATTVHAAMLRCRSAVLTIHPGAHRTAELGDSVPHVRTLLARGVSMRSLIRHTYRHSPLIAAHFEGLDGDLQVRTLDEVTERLVVCDRTVAFIPADVNSELMLEVRHPGIVAHFVAGFDRLWRSAASLHPTAAPIPSADGATARQRAVAAMIVEGETDARIAERLGMNVRTCRAHVAGLSELLGSRSRGQLGYLIGKSGILDSES